MASYLITGCSRGLGLSLATILATRPSSNVGKVFASARSESEGLKRLIQDAVGHVEFVQLDVASKDSAEEAANQVEKSLGDKGLDVLINNAGVMTFTSDGIETM